VRAGALPPLYPESGSEHKGRCASFLVTLRGYRRGTAPVESTTAPALPAELQVEVSGACNLRCRMCLVRYAPAVGKREGALSYEQFLSLVDGLPNLRKLTLQGLGEPLLSPHLLDMVEHAASRGVEVGFNTNGTLLSRQVAERLVEVGCGWLHVSLDGATAPTYEDVRHGTDFRPHPGQFERVVSNLRVLREVRGSGTAPRVQVVFVAMRRNIEELPALVSLAGDIGVDSVWVQNLSHDFGDTDPDGAYRAIREYAEHEALFDSDLPAAQRLFDRAAARARAVGVDLRLPSLEQRERDDGVRGCDWPWDSAYVTHRGEVQPCCMVMGSERATMGRLDKESFERIWHAPPYRSFRAALLTDDPPDVCRGCSLYRRVF
jgi:radical SAM protein with 4Fe4S-binding SPASM domain